MSKLCCQVNEYQFFNPISKFFEVFKLVLRGFILIGSNSMGQFDSLISLTNDYRFEAFLIFIVLELTKILKMHAHCINAQIAKDGIMTNFRTIIWDLLVNTSDNVASENIISLQKRTLMQYSGMKYYLYRTDFFMFEHEFER